ncbi:uncharacterized protein LOC130998156 [Salvia miltiorrhiza]|uniref:uncharacterized protein LOC130998156 n=1 Tax=Salvia miltiorrhiza TaxID=226208 RepID=UPI0025AC7B0A|nr:uncharacterized protein LOC130998156 [Salvia miltiorrhiza]
MDIGVHKLGNMHNSWTDYTSLRTIGVSLRAAPPPKVVNMHWWPLVAPWIKVNTDGSALGAPSNIAPGDIFRDSWAWVRGCFHFTGGVGFSFEAELLAIILVVQIAYSRGRLHLWIESDFFYIVHLLQSRSTSVPWRFAASWRKVLELLKDFRLQVTHIFREENHVVDIMAHQNTPEGW